MINVVKHVKFTKTIAFVKIICYIEITKTIKLILLRLKD